MARDFKHALTGDIAGRYRGTIYGASERFEGFVPKNFHWFTTNDLTQEYRYIWVYRYNGLKKDGEHDMRPFSFLKVKQKKGLRGPSKKTLLKMIDELTQRVLEFEADDEIHVVTLGQGRSKLKKKRRK